MANQIFIDSYLFDFLGTDMPRREVKIENQLTESLPEKLKSSLPSIEEIEKEVE
ncbi:MAG: hypothetical protein PHY47_15025 [Lachnospiraceae bacterium]|nr:hypothetical protein [Lachnospiraceae bacterium]